jgi:hypothetical protein
MKKFWIDAKLRDHSDVARIAFAPQNCRCILIASQGNRCLSVVRLL